MGSMIGILTLQPSTTEMDFATAASTNMVLNSLYLSSKKAASRSSWKHFLKCPPYLTLPCILSSRYNLDNKLLYLKFYLLRKVRSLLSFRVNPQWSCTSHNSMEAILAHDVDSVKSSAPADSKLFLSSQLVIGTVHEAMGTN
jgi:hypothetical protein